MRCIIIKPQEGVIEMHVPEGRVPDVLSFVECENPQDEHNWKARFKRIDYKPLQAVCARGETYWIYLRNTK